MNDAILRYMGIFYFYFFRGFRGKSRVNEVRCMLFIRNMARDEFEWEWKGFVVGSAGSVGNKQVAFWESGFM